MKLSQKIAAAVVMACLSMVVSLTPAFAESTTGSSATTGITGVEIVRQPRCMEPMTQLRLEGELEPGAVAKWNDQRGRHGTVKKGVAVFDTSYVRQGEANRYTVRVLPENGSQPVQSFSVVTEVRPDEEWCAENTTFKEFSWDGRLKDRLNESRPGQTKRVWFDLDLIRIDSAPPLQVTLKSGYTFEVEGAHVDGRPRAFRYEFDLPGRARVKYMDVPPVAVPADSIPVLRGWIRRVQFLDGCAIC